MSTNIAQPGQVMIAFDPAGDIDRFRAWYERTKIPAVLSVPGVTAATQWVVEHKYTEGPEGGQVIIPAPHDYVVFFELEDVTLSRSEAFLDAVGRSFHETVALDGESVEYEQVMRLTLGTVRDAVNPGAESTKTGAMLVVSITPERDYTEMFHRWYDEEHVGELMSCPGFIRTRRYRALDGVPNYFAIYELDDAAALQTEAFRGFSGRQHEELPPVHQQVAPHMQHNLCDVYRRLD